MPTNDFELTVPDLYSKNYLLPPANEVAERQCFHKRLSSILSTGWTCLPDTPPPPGQTRQTPPWAYTTPGQTRQTPLPGRHTPMGRHPLPPLGRHPPGDGHRSGRYASYWNAFLLIFVCAFRIYWYRECMCKVSVNGCATGKQLALTVSNFSWQTGEICKVIWWDIGQTLFFQKIFRGHEFCCGTTENHILHFLWRLPVGNIWRNCDILVDVKDGGLSFRRDLYCEKIAKTGGRKKRDHYWDRYGLNFFTTTDTGKNGVWSNLSTLW